MSCLIVLFMEGQILHEPFENPKIKSVKFLGVELRSAWDLSR